MKSNNQSYSVNELLKDDFFIRWVFNPDADSNHYWTGMMEKDPELRKKINRAREILSLMNYENKYKLNEDEYNDMLEILVRENRFAKYQKPKKVIKFSFIGIAASIILIATAGVLAGYLDINQSGVELVSNAETVIKNTRAGEKLTMKLPDGTTVKLNSLTNLTYTSEFTGDFREVYLEGEAYFDVTKDASKPFIIHTGEMRTTVLGTEFNVRSYAEEENIEVAVVEGKVKVENHDEDYIYLTPNEVGTYKKAEQKIRKEKKDVSNLIAWYKNILVFDKSSPEEIWNTLENWYGVKITVLNNKKIEGRYSGTYENEPLETVLRGISYASGFDYEIDEKKNVVIK